MGVAGKPQYTAWHVTQIDVLFLIKEWIIDTKKSPEVYVYLHLHNESYATLKTFLFGDALVYQKSKAGAAKPELP